MATVPALRVLAHQGGWDEILFVVAPLLIFAWLLALARRRVDRMEGQSPSDAPEADADAADRGSEPTP